MGHGGARRTVSNLLLAIGSLTMLVGLLGGAAGAVDEGPGYQDRSYSVSGSRRFNAQADRTTFTFKVTGEGPAEYFLINACEAGAAFVRAFGPDDQQPVETAPDEPTGHESLKFEPGTLGTYTVLYRHDIGGAELIIKNGDGHRHFHVGTGCPDGTEVTTSSRSERSTTTTTEQESSSTTTEKESTTTTKQKPSTTTTEEPTTTTEEPTTTTEEPTTTTEEPTTTTEEPTTTTEEPTTTTEEPTTTTEEPTSTTEEPTTTMEEPTTTTEEPTTSSDPPTTVTLAELPSPSPGPGGGGGSGTSSRLLLVGLPLALSGLTIRFGDPDDRT